MAAPIDVASLTLEEKLQLLEQIWDSLPIGADDAVIPGTHAIELDRDLAPVDRDGGERIPLQQALRLIGARRR